MNFYNYIPSAQVSRHAYEYYKLNEKNDVNNKSEIVEKEKEEKSQSTSSNENNSNVKAEDLNKCGSSINSQGFGHNDKPKGPPIYDLEKRKQMGVLSNKAYQLHYNIDIPIEKSEEDKFGIVVSSDTDEPPPIKRHKPSISSKHNFEKSKTGNYFSYEK